MPESSHNATEASRQVGAAELTPSPTVAAKVRRIDETAAAVRAPASIGVHCNVQASGARVLTAGVTSTGGASMLLGGASPQAEERKNGHDDDDQADQVNQSVHIVLLLETVPR